MERVSVYCVNTESDATADVLERSDKRIKVVFTTTDMTLVLTRQDNRQPYIGSMSGLTFETFGELE